ncbi:MAG: hypothetical protein IPM69_07085 [Ignavibacteria bacterium]|nr:hypothetical protein [Ignavibacteria bacterium]
MKTIIVILFLSVSTILAQEKSTPLEPALEVISRDSDDAPLLNTIEYYADHPIILRSANPRTLLFLPGVSLANAKKIIRLAKNYPQLSLTEIADSVHLTEAQYVLLERCVLLENPKDTKPAWLSYRTRTQHRVQENKGILDSAFIGSSLTLYQRITGGVGNFSAGVTASKAPGERTINDFMSGFAEYKDNSFRLVLGDFTAESGLGSIIWQGFGSKKGSEVISPVIQQGSGISPYRSSIEYRYFRGAAVEATIPIADNSSLEIIGFYSSIRRSGSIDSAQNVATSLDISGLFRTSSEIAKRNALGEKTIGLIAEWTISRAWTIGASALSLRYEKPIVSSSTSVFSGQSGVLTSLYSAYSSANSLLLGEFSRDAGGNNGLKFSMEFTGKNVKSALGIRYFSPEFRSPFGYNFGEFPSPSNEAGVYTGLFWRGAPGLELMAYADLYQSIRPRFGMYSPTRGADILAECRWKITRPTMAVFRFHTENKTDGFTSEDGLRGVYQRTVTSLRAEVQHEATPEIRTRFRMEAVYCDFEKMQPREVGVVGFGEIWWRSERWKIGARIAYFSTDSYASARWTFEPSVPGVLGNPALYGNGARSFILLNYKPIPQLSLGANYTVTAKNSVTSLGSGTSEIEGNAEQKFIFQMDVSL